MQYIVPVRFSESDLLVGAATLPCLSPEAPLARGLLSELSPVNFVLETTARAQTTLFAPAADLNEVSCKPPSRISLGVFALPANRDVQAHESLASGVVSGIATRTVTAPLTTIKTLFQLQPLIMQTSIPSLLQKSQSRISTESIQGYRGIVDAVQKIVHSEGVSGLWKGTLTGCLRFAPYSGVKFLVFDMSKEIAGVEDACGQMILDPVQTFCYGALAGVLATVTTYPLDLIQVRQILQKRTSPTYRSLFHAFKTIYQEEKLHGLFKGVYSSVLGVIPFEGMQFATYEGIKQLALHRMHAKEERNHDGRNHERKHHEHLSLSVSETVLAGIIAGSVSQTVAYPWDLVRTRLACQSNSPGMCAPKYKGMTDCFRKIIAEEGLQGLFKGCAVNLLNVGPRAAVTFTSYEAMKHFFESHHHYDDYIP